jgi:NAD(P)-dependent dehydrogenase (short-subunit alcohol dehydrogenase family)
MKTAAKVGDNEIGIKMETNSPTVLIVGASRGLGWGLAQEYLARGWRVIATERAPDQTSPLRKLADASDDALEIEQVDINEPRQVESLRTKLRDQKLDLLFVNAGVLDDKKPIGEVETDEFVRLMVTNALSPLRVIEALGDLVKPHGTIAAMTSGLASIENNTVGGYEAYRASKAALNMLLRSYAARVRSDRTLLAVAPGWVKTDMGGSDAMLELETSVRGMADMIAARSGKKGLVFVNYLNEALPW